MDRTSLQDRLDRVRCPGERPSRLRIAYDVQLADGVRQVELPFVVGVLADLSGHPAQPPRPLIERKFVVIDRDNLNEVLARAGARLALQLPDRLADADGELAVELSFKDIDDFEPARVAEQIGPLRQLLEMRRELIRLLGSMEGNDQLEKLLAEVLADADKASATARSMDASTPSAAAAPPPAPTVTTDTAADSFLDQVIKATRPRDAVESEQARTHFRRFLDQAVKPGQVMSNDVEANVKRWIDEIDQRLSAQLNAVLHHPEFQKLEGTWRGLHYLVYSTETGEHLKIRVLNVTRTELFDDLEQAALDQAAEFDQTMLFRKIYEEEFRSLGGQPYGLLVGDFEFGREARDIRVLQRLAAIAACAHAPFVAAASPRMFGFDRDFTEMTRPRDLTKIFDAADYQAWHAFRDTPEARYVALALPRVLARLPYGEHTKQVEEFRFEEVVDGVDHGNYLWMSAAWAYAVCVTTAFAKDGWLVALRGVEGGGKVEGLPAHAFLTSDGLTSDGGVAMNCCVEIAINERREWELDALGFLPLLHLAGSGGAVFFSAASCAKPKHHESPEAAAGALMATKLNLTLGASRFVHCLMVMNRDKIGSGTDADWESWLNEWIKGYVPPDPQDLSRAALVRFPLREARVEVRPMPGKPGRRQLIVWLRLNLPNSGWPLLKLVADQ
ncbi:MAG: type VI secretion system contractile sheath large subunit [Gemmataceae bacterium]|nr:type VI secretion system contractile sheath large subunit [Gemmataceae bacterium]